MDTLWDYVIASGVFGAILLFFFIIASVFSAPSDQVKQNGWRVKARKEQEEEVRV